MPAGLQPASCHRRCTIQLNDRELLAALSSIILPLIIALIQQPTWPDRTRAIVGFVCVFVWTVLGVLYIGEGLPQTVDYHAWIRLLLVNAVTSYTLFQSVYKPMGIVQRVEAKTSKPSAARERLKNDAARKETPPMDVG